MFCSFSIPVAIETQVVHCSRGGHGVVSIVVRSFEKIKYGLFGGLMGNVYSIDIDRYM